LEESSRKYVESMKGILEKLNKLMFTGENLSLKAISDERSPL